MSFEIVLSTTSFLAGHKIKGYLEFHANTSIVPQTIELRLSCTFCGGELVNPVLTSRRMNIPQTSTALAKKLPFEYPLPKDLPVSREKIIGGKDLGVGYFLTARLIPAGIFSRSISTSVRVQIRRQDSGDGIKVKFVKFGGRPFKELLAEASEQNVVAC